MVLGQNLSHVIRGGLPVCRHVVVRTDGSTPERRIIVEKDGSA